MTKASKNEHAPNVNIKIKKNEGEKWEANPMSFSEPLKIGEASAFVIKFILVAALKVQEEHLKRTKTNWCN